MLRHPSTKDCLALLVVAFVGLTWFQSADYLWTPDSNFPFDIPSSIDRYFEVWDYRTIPGNVDVKKLPFIIPWALLLAGWNLLSLPFQPWLFQRLIVIGLLGASLVSGYVLFQVIATQLRIDLLRRRMGGILAGLLYGFNFYSMLTIWSTLAFLMFAYAFFPLVLALILYGLRKRSTTRFAALTALVWTLTLTPAYVTTPVVGTDWAFILVVSLVFLFAAKPGQSNLRKGGGFLLKTFGFWLLFNLYWIVLLGSLGSVQLTRFSGGLRLFVLNSAPLSEAFRLAGYWGLEASYKGSRFFPWAEIYTIPWLLLIGFIPIALAIIGLARRDRSPEMLGLATLLTIALFLVKGPYPPFGIVNQSVWGIDLIGTSYRGVFQRFMGYVALPIAILAPLGALTLSDSLRIFRWPRIPNWIVPVTITTVVGVLSMAHALPAFSGAIFENEGVIPSFRVTLPDSWYDLAWWLESEEGDFAILPFPYPVSTGRTALSINNGSAGLLGIYPLLTLTTRAIVMGQGPGAEVASLLSMGTLNDSRLLSILNVRFVIVHLDANIAYLEGNPGWVMIQPDSLIRNLEGIPALDFAVQFGQTVVYENTEWIQGGLLLFPSVSGVRTQPEKDGVETDATLTGGWIAELNPTFLTFRREEGSNTDIRFSLSPGAGGAIVWARTFDRGWTLELDGRRVSDSSHFTALGNLNAWVLDQDDGREGRIYYAPQLLLVPGLVISTTGLILTASYLLYSYIVVRPRMKAGRDELT